MRRMDVIVATIAATAAFLAPTTAALIQARDDLAPAPRESCIVLVDRVADLARDHPELAGVYGERGPSKLPPLASPRESEHCGDPELVLGNSLAGAPLVGHSHRDGSHRQTRPRCPHLPTAIVDRARSTRTRSYLNPGG